MYHCRIRLKKFKLLFTNLFFLAGLIIDVKYQLVPVFLPYFTVKVLKSLDQEIITLYKSVMLKEIIEEIVALLMCTFDFSKKSKSQEYLSDSYFCYFVVQGKYFKLYISDMVRLKEINDNICNLDTYKLRFLYG